MHWGNLHDQIPHFILAMYFHAVNTGNIDFVRKVMPALDKVGRYMLSLDRDRDGVAEIPATSGLPNGERDCSNWYDIIKFGHKDAYINVYCCAALNAMVELKAFMGDDAAAARYRGEHRRAIEGFNRVFWDDERGFYMDWIDAREKLPESGRRYFYTDPNLLAIIFGVADSRQSIRMELRFAQRARATKDLDLGMEGARTSRLQTLSEALRLGFDEFTFRVKAQTRDMARADTIRVQVAIQYRTRSWQTIEIDLGPAEVAASTWWSPEFRVWRSWEFQSFRRSDVWVLRTRSRRSSMRAPVRRRRDGRGMWWIFC